MNKKDPSNSSNGLTNVSSLTANIETLERENHISVNDSRNGAEKSKSSKKYNEDDLKEHTRILKEFKNALDGILNNIKEYNINTNGFFDTKMGFAVMFLSFLGICVAPIFLSGSMMIYAFIGSLIVFLTSVGIKTINYSSKKKRKAAILIEFKENRRRIKYFLNRNNQIKTYIALSHNSIYRRTFNANLFKLLKDEIEKNNKDEFKINYRIWEECSKEIERGMKNKIKNK